jgi:hypothetical protein
MGVLAFLFRMVLRLTVWVLALVGALVVIGGLLWTFVIWPGVERAYPDMASQVMRANGEAYAVTELVTSGALDCDAALENLNSLAALSSGQAHLTALLLDELNNCGPIAGTNLDSAFMYRSMNQRDIPTFDMRLSDYRLRLIRLSGLEGQARFWRDYYAIAECTEYNYYHFDLPNWESYQQGDWTYRDIRLAQYQRSYVCSQQLETLARQYLDDPILDNREHAVWLMTDAARFSNSDARWWHEFVFPTLDQTYFGNLTEITFETYRFSGPCSSLMRNPTDGDLHGQSLREMAAMGQADATDQWLSYGPFEIDEPFRSCTEDEYPDLFRHSQAWNGGYDTPFWYAVHAIRIQHETGLSHLLAIEAEIGADCLALAREIAMGLRAILPGPPVDDPQLRQLILSSIRCQPEGLRDPAEYWNEHYSLPDSAGYLPPEAVYALPSFEPIFRRVASTEVPEN